MIPLSDATRARIERLFAESDWHRVGECLLHECGDNLPMVETGYADLAERVRFAVLKLSQGNYERLVKQAGKAAVDWRDVLVAAGFADDTRAHLAWQPGSS